jgi:nicotinamidase-related amidase
VLENRPIDLNLVDSVRKYQQIIIQRQEWDIFSNPITERLLRALPSHAIVFGVPTEHSIKLAAIGLQQRGVKAAVLSDMVLPLEPRSVESANQEMRKAGVEFLALEMLFSIYSG